MQTFLIAFTIIVSAFDAGAATYFLLNKRYGWFLVMLWLSIALFIEITPYV